MNNRTFLRLCSDRRRGKDKGLKTLVLENTGTEVLAPSRGPGPHGLRFSPCCDPHCSLCAPVQAPLLLASPKRSTPRRARRSHDRGKRRFPLGRKGGIPCSGVALAANLKTGLIPRPSLHPMIPFTKTQCRNPCGDCPEWHIRA